MKETAPASANSRNPRAAAARTHGVFVSYRQGEFDDRVAAWLVEALDHEPCELEPGRTVKLEVFRDRNQPAVPDWLSWATNKLAKARAFVLISTPAAVRIQQGRVDELHRELNWWLRKRPKVAPIVIDPTRERAGAVPERLAERFPRIQRIEVDIDSEGSRVQALERIRGGIVLSETGVHLDALRKRSRRRMVLAVLTGLALAAVLIAANQRMDAERARHRSGISARAARATSVSASKPLEAVTLAMQAARDAAAEGDPVLAEQASWEVLTRVGGAALVQHESAITSLALAELSLTAGTQDGKVLRWGRKHGASPTRKAGHKAKVESIFAAHGDAVLTLGADGRVLGWSPEAKAPTVLLEDRKGLGNLTTPIAVQGRWLATIDAGSVQILEIGRAPLAVRPDKGFQVGAGVGVPISITLSEDSEARYLAVGGTGRQVSMWDRRTEAAFQLVYGRKYREQAAVLAFSPEGTWLAVGGASRVQVWPIHETGPSEAPLELKSGTAQVRHLAFLSENELVTASMNGEVRLWRLTRIPTELEQCAGEDQGDPQSQNLSGHPCERIQAKELCLGKHDGLIKGLDLHRASRRIATAGEDQTVGLWQLKELNDSSNAPQFHHWKLRGHDGPVQAVAIDEQRIVAGDSLGGLRSWSLSDGDPSSAMPTPGPFDPKTLRSMAISDSGDRIAAVRGNKEVTTWRRPEGTGPWLPARRWGADQALAHSITLSASGRWLSTCRDDARARVWDLDAGETDWEPHLTIKLPPRNGTCTIAFSPDEQCFAAVQRGNSVPHEVGVTALGKRECSAKLSIDGAASALQFSPDSQWLITAANGALTAWNMGADSSAPARSGIRIGDAPSRSYDIQFSRDGRWLAAGGHGSRPGTVRVWQWQARLDGPLNRVSLPHHDQESALAFALSDDGQHLAVAPEGKPVVWVWRLDEPSSPPIELEGHTEPVTDLAFVEDGRRIASGGKDGTIRLWALTTDRSPSETHIVLRGRFRELSKLAAFGRDSSWLASIGHTAGNGPPVGVQIWPLDLEDRIDIAERVIGATIPAANPSPGLREALTSWRR